MREERVAAGRTRLNSARERRVRLGSLTDARRTERQAEAAQLKRRRRAWAAERESERQAVGEEVAARVAAARSLDARLDASESARDATEQAEGARMSAALQLSLSKMRRDKLAYAQRMVVAGVRARSAVDDARQTTLAAAGLRGEAVREQESEWSRRRRQQEAQYVANARQQRERVLAGRQACKENATEALHERRANAHRGGRASAALASRASAHQKAALQSNRDAVAAVYTRRFVSRADEEAWSASPLRKLHRSSARFQATSARGSGSGGGGGDGAADESNREQPLMARPRSARAAVRA